MFPEAEVLPHLICSRPMFIGSVTRPGWGRRRHALCSVTTPPPTRGCARPTPLIGQQPATGYTEPGTGPFLW